MKYSKCVLWGGGECVEWQWWWKWCKLTDTLKKTKLTRKAKANENIDDIDQTIKKVGFFFSLIIKYLIVENQRASHHQLLCQRRLCDCS